MSGPFLDRMDLVVPMVPSTPAQLAAAEPGESTELLRTRIEQARQRQAMRLAGTGIRTNAEIPARGDLLQRLAPLSNAAARLLESMSLKHRLSPRAQHRLRRVALTLQDLTDDAPVGAAISVAAMAQALQLRRLPDMSVG